MANKTSIEWTDYNWNFLRGCSRVSEGCRNCYAEGIAARFSGEGRPYHGLAKMVNHDARWTGEISFHEDILLQALRWKKPRRVFVNSMSDLFHEKVKDEWLDKAFAVMALTPQHTYQILTKRPERMKEYITTPFVSNRVFDQMSKLTPDTGVWSWPTWNSAMKNVWLGVSVEDQKTADERIPLLLQTPAAVRWISAEPLLGPVDLKNIKHRLCSDDAEIKPVLGVFEDIDSIRGERIRGRVGYQCERLDWIVVGGESGHGARPFDVAWARSIVKQCKAAGVPVFVKQLGAKPIFHSDYEEFPLPIKNQKGGDMNEWPEDLRIRLMPEVK